MKYENVYSTFLKLKKVEGKNEYLWRETSNGDIVYKFDFREINSEFAWDISPNGEIILY